MAIFGTFFWEQYMIMTFIIMMFVIPVFIFVFCLLFLYLTKIKDEVLTPYMLIEDLPYGSKIVIVMIMAISLGLMTGSLIFVS